MERALRPSPISAEAVAAQGIRLGSVAVDGADVYWLERRPHEGGRSVLVRPIHPQAVMGRRTMPEAIEFPL